MRAILPVAKCVQGWTDAGLAVAAALVWPGSCRCAIQGRHGRQAPVRAAQYEPVAVTGASPELDRSPATGARQTRGSIR